MTVAVQTEVTEAEVPSHLVSVHDRVMAEEAEWTLPEDRAEVEAHEGGKLDFFLTGHASVFAESFTSGVMNHPRQSPERLAAIQQMREFVELLEFNETVLGSWQKVR